jgi:hypothetical protein
VILDLEDSVHPLHKAAARLLVRNALRAVDFGGAERMVRINQLPLGLEDLDDVVVPERPDLILIPKTERPEQVLEVARAHRGDPEDHLARRTARPSGSCPSSSRRWAWRTPSPLPGVAERRGADHRAGGLHGGPGRGEDAGGDGDRSGRGSGW